MATVTWPASAHFQPRSFTLGARVPKSGFQAFFTQQVTSINHLGQRLVLTLQLRACGPVEAAERAAFITSLVSSGDWVRVGLPLRTVPRGTLRGSPSVFSNAAAGARSFVINATPAETLLADDVLSVGDQLLSVAYAGAVVGGGGQVSVPLQLPLRLPLTAAQAVVWNAPTGLFQLMADQLDIPTSRSQWQQPLAVPLREVF